MKGRLSVLFALTALAAVTVTIAIAGSDAPRQSGAGDRGAPQLVAEMSVTAASAPSASFTPPPDSAIPNNEFGKAVRAGEAIFTDPVAHAGQYVGNTLRCSNCHLEAGRLANASPMWGAYGEYPAYRSKNGHVNSFQERLQGCFRFSMNGKAPPLGDPVLVALESYSYFLSKGAPIGASLPGRGYPELAKPAQKADFARGDLIYQQKCALCHGANGEGQSSNGQTVFPSLWGKDSFNWGAGMGSVKNAAEFIKANMPLGQGNTLTDQEAWDVAMFMDSHERPQDPRFIGSVEQTRAKYHDTPMSMYGQLVNGVLLGENSPPSGETGE
ncbi:MAG: c-type cytochrome [Methylocella sp.]